MGRWFLMMALQGCVVFVGETHGLHSLKLTASSPLKMGKKKFNMHFHGKTIHFLGVKLG